MVNLSPSQYAHLCNFKSSDVSSVDLRRSPQYGPVVTKTYFDTRACEGGVPDEGHVFQMVPFCENVVQLLEVHTNFPKSGQCTLVFKYCNGGTLEEFSAYAESTGNFFPETLLWHIFIQLSVALDHCHTHGVDQGDFNSSNIYLHCPSDRSEFPTVVLGDFDLAGPVTILQPGDKVSPWNVFQLGYLIHGVMQSAHQPPNGWSDTLRYWMERCTDRDRNRRPTSHELVNEMVPLARKLLNDNVPLKLPDWAFKYFTDNSAESFEHE